MNDENDTNLADLASKAVEIRDSAPAGGGVPEGHLQTEDGSVVEMGEKDLGAIK